MFRIILGIFFVILFGTVSICQTLGLYEFTGSGVCPNPFISVTSQPVNATFGSYNSVGTNCSATNDVFNNSNWNTTSTINLLEYNEFSISADPCYHLFLNEFTFSHRISNVTSIPTWFLRSSVDDFSVDLANGISSTTITPSTITLPPNHQNIGGVIFRLYLSSATASSTTWRNDNVFVTGVVNPITPQNYYADVDGDSFGDALSTISACSLPVGYVLDNQDCDDGNVLINPNTVWFQDFDADNFGNSLVQYIGCEASVGYTLNNGDCDDLNSLVTIATDVFYSDYDLDGFGDSSIYQVSCTMPDGYVLNNLDCDDSDGLVTIATNVFYEDLDLDGFGNSLVSIIRCIESLGIVSNSSDCNDLNPLINEDVPDINGNGIDENCDGVDGYLSILDFKHSTFKIYPSPAKDVIFITFDLKYENSVIRVIDTRGIVLLNNKITSQVDITNLKKGVYFLQIEGESVFFYQRIVVEK